MSCSCNYNPKEVTYLTNEGLEFLCSALKEQIDKEIEKVNERINMIGLSGINKESVKFDNDILTFHFIDDSEMDVEVYNHPMYEAYLALPSDIDKMFEERA